MSHVPVLLKETLDYLNAAEGKKFIDGTVGNSGHAFAILKANSEAKVLGIDLDQASVDHLRREVVRQGLDQRISLVQGSYRDIEKIVQEENFGQVDGILLDLGFSSSQLDDPKRGFSFQIDGPLDMRYDVESKLTAEEVVNRYHQDKLERILSEYGEEKFARRISVAIIAKRKESRIITTTELSTVIKYALPISVRFKSNDSIRRVFQGIRIEVNRELENLEKFLPKAIKLLNPKGRLVIISFHSLEDRTVKEFFNHEAKDCVCPPEFPICICDKVSTIKVLTRKPVTATEEEISLNSRSKPAKLRACEKI